MLIIARFCLIGKLSFENSITLHMSRLKGISFETAIIERYRRRESSVEEALIEMYLAGVSVRRVEDITEEAVPKQNFSEAT